MKVSNSAFLVIALCWCSVGTMQEDAGKKPIRVTADAVAKLRVFQSNLREAFNDKDRRDLADVSRETAYAVVDSLFQEVVTQAEVCSSLADLHALMESKRDADAVELTERVLIRRAQANAARAAQMMAGFVKNMPDSMPATRVQAQVAREAANATVDAIRNQLRTLKVDDSLDNGKK